MPWGQASPCDNHFITQSLPLFLGLMNAVITLLQVEWSAHLSDHKGGFIIEELVHSTAQGCTPSEMLAPDWGQSRENGCAWDFCLFLVNT